MRCGHVVGLAILIFAAVSQIHALGDDDGDAQQANRQLTDVDVQGHENTSGRVARQFGFGFPPPPPPFGFGGPGFGGPGFGGPGFGGPGFGGGFGGGYRQMVRVRQRVRQRQSFRGGFYG